MAGVTVSERPRVEILGPDGRPLPSVSGAATPRAGLSAGAFQAAGGGQDLGGWTPWHYSADAALNPERDAISSRIRDLARNDGWASATLTTFVNNVIGSGLRLAALPDYRALGLDEEWAAEWARQVEAQWRGYANDPGNYCDASRRAGMGGLFAQAFRHRLIDGEALALPVWLPGRGGRYATAFQLVHPARLSNPNDLMDTERMRGGVEIDGFGAAVAYHIRAGHPGDTMWSVLARASRWERVPRETRWGRPRAIHYFEPEEAEQTRGRSPLTPVVKRLRMSGRFEESELQAAVLNALLAIFIESSAPPEAIAEMLAGGTSEFDRWQQSRLSLHEKAPLRINGSRIPILPPGDTIRTPVPSRPNPNGQAFVDAGVRQFAAAVGLSYEQVSRDYSRTNYSSARAAMLEAFKMIATYQAGLGAGFATPCYAAWLEEAIDRGDVELPPGAPAFEAARSAYVRCRWIGPPRGWVDPVKEAQAAGERVRLGISTLQQEAADQGHDWEDIADQQMRERAFFEARGMQYPPTQPAAGAPQSPAERRGPDDDERERET